MSYKPTCQIKWVDVKENDKLQSDKVVGRFHGGSTYFCLKQLWVSDLEGEEDEWRDIEIEP